MAAGFKPLGPSRIVMDTSLAMSLLGFASSTSFDNTEIEEVQAAFMRKILLYEHYCRAGSSSNPRVKTSKRDELRRVNEAYQFLIRKRRKLTGRAMNENWQLVGGKSNKAMDIIASLKFSSTASTSSSVVEERKKAEGEFKRMQEIESEAAKALAEELVMSAGLEMPVVDILNQANKNPSLPTASLINIPKASKSGKDHTAFLTEEKHRRPSAFVGPNHQPVGRSNSSGTSATSSAATTTTTSASERSSASGTPTGSRKSSRQNRVKSAKKSGSKSQPDTPPPPPSSSSNLGSGSRPTEVVASMSDLRGDEKMARNIPDEESEENLPLRKAVSNLNINTVDEES